MKWRFAFFFIEQLFERGSRSRPANENFFVFDPADHVHVDHGDGLVPRKRRLLYPLRRSKKAQLFSREIRKKNAALEFSLLRRQESREFEHARGAGSVVIGAGMNLPDLRGRERVDIPVSEV